MALCASSFDIQCSKYKAGLKKSEQGAPEWRAKKKKKKRKQRSLWNSGAWGAKLAVLFVWEERHTVSLPRHSERLYPKVGLWANVCRRERIERSSERVTKSLPQHGVRFPDQHALRACDQFSDQNSTCFCFSSDVLFPVLSLVCYLNVFTCSVSRTWLVCLFIPCCSCSWQAVLLSRESSFPIYIPCPCLYPSVTCVIFYAWCDLPGFWAPAWTLRLRFVLDCT